jgi:hypothetical protein
VNPLRTAIVLAGFATTATLGAACGSDSQSDLVTALPNASSVLGSNGGAIVRVFGDRDCMQVNVTPTLATPCVSIGSDEGLSVASAYRGEGVQVFFVVTGTDQPLVASWSSRGGEFPGMRTVEVAPGTQVAAFTFPIDDEVLSVQLRTQDGALLREMQLTDL